MGIRKKNYKRDGNLNASMKTPFMGKRIKTETILNTNGVV
jgi:hypothetical protein